MCKMTLFLYFYFSSVLISLNRFFVYTWEEVFCIRLSESNPNEPFLDYFKVLSTHSRFLRHGPFRFTLVSTGRGKESFTSPTGLSHVRGFILSFLVSSHSSLRFLFS